MNPKNGSILLAVNGTLMRGLELNPNLLAAGGTFVRKAKTAARYRMWSIHDRYPGMMLVNRGGAAIDLEIWAVPPAGLVEVLQREPAGLAIGKITLADGEEVLGVLAEAYVTEGKREITTYRGWRAYIADSVAAV